MLRKIVLVIVLVIGTRNQTKPRIEAKFRGRADIRFFDDAGGSASIAKRAKQADIVVLNSSLARHTHMYALREAQIPFVLTQGAESAICKAIDEQLACKP